MVNHRRGGGKKIFDNRDVQSKTAYLRAVLASRSLFAKGVRGFVSGRYISYYELLLAKQADVVAGLGAAAYKKMMPKADTGEGHDCEDESALGAVSNQPEDVALVSASSVVFMDSGTETEDEPSAKMPPRPPRKKPKRAKCDDIIAIEPSAIPPVGFLDSDTEDDAAMPAPVASPDLPGECVIEGATVRQRGDYRKNGRVHNKRWIITKCPFHGTDCSKSRAVSLDQDFAPHGTRIFLGAWVVNGVNLAAEDHSNDTPSSADMFEYAASVVLPID